MARFTRRLLDDVPSAQPAPPHDQRATCSPYQAPCAGSGAPSSHAARTPLQNVWWVERLLIATIVLGLGLSQAVVITIAQEATPTSVSSIGLTRADPAPLGDPVQAGPVELQVLDVLSGQEAVASILAASPTNVEPRDGTTYVAVNLAARNTGSQPLWLDNDDFAMTGDSSLLWHFLGAQPPDPALDVTLNPGESTKGWVAFGVPIEEGSLLLIFDSLELGGSWADRVLAIQDGARIPDLAERTAAPNDAGTDFITALGIGEAAVTDQWSVELLDVVTDAAAFDLVDYRTGALGVSDAIGEDGSVWIALRFRIQNSAAGGELAYLPANAFVLVDDAGNPLLDIATLTPPRPDAAGGYYPGAVRDGWVMFDVPLDYATSTVRFLPFAHTATSLDPRFFSYG
jgi:hypothetical protein